MHIREQAPTASALRKIKSMHRWMIGILIAYIPVVILLYLLQLPEWLILVSAVGLICLGIVIAFMLGFSRCPDCKQYFHVRGMTGNIFSGKCLHCGITIP